MIIGIGNDLTVIKDIEYLLEHMKEGALMRMFTDKELFASSVRSDRAAYLAGRFSAKEAVYKAFGGTAGSGKIDLRNIEILSQEDGSPQVIPSDDLRRVMSEVGVRKIHVSICHEGGYAMAFAVAEG